jgi:ribonuclease Y
MEYIVGIVAGLVLGILATYGFLFIRKKDARNQAQSILDEAKRLAVNEEKEAQLRIKEAEITQREKLEREINKQKDELQKLERQLDKRENQLDQKADGLQKQEQMVATNQKRLAERLESAIQREKDIDLILEKQKKKLHEITGLSHEEATKQLLKLLENDLANEAGAIILKHEQKVRESCEEKTRELIIGSIYRYAAPHTADSTSSTVDIPSDEMKGRIIGREGRNIRAFEKETGVDVIIDDTPGVVIVSGFDPVRREVARQSLAKLIEDGRIHPARIEEIVKETEKEIDAFLRKKGQEAAQEADVQGLHEKIIYLLGRLHFRTSYSQNVLRHSIEVAFVASMLAEMIGFDARLARRCGLLHDIGKAADHDLEGGHPKVGADLLKRHGEGPEVVHAALGHHDQIFSEYPYTVLVATADACSASRPGARRESLDRYIKRMEELETIAKEIKEVKHAFAVQAGREVRVIVGAEEANDERAAKICRDIAHEFQERLTFPGEIKVTVIRESRFIEIAK